MPSDALVFRVIGEHGEIVVAPYEVVIGRAEDAAEVAAFTTREWCEEHRCSAELQVQDPDGLIFAKDQWLIVRVVRP